MIQNNTFWGKIILKSCHQRRFNSLYHIHSSLKKKSSSHITQQISVQFIVLDCLPLVLLNICNFAYNLFQQYLCSIIQYISSKSRIHSKYMWVTNEVNLIENRTRTSNYLCRNAMASYNSSLMSEHCDFYSNRKY